MRKLVLITVLIIVSAPVMACEGAEPQVSPIQAAFGALLVTGGIVGGVYMGTAISESNNASDGSSIVIATASSLVIGAAVGFLYNAFLDIFDLKMKFKCGKPVNAEKDETPDFMLPEQK